MRLNRDLRRSRKKLVAAREEERRRILRDLHDGLGPLLASQTLTLDAIERQLESNPQAARALIKDLKSQADSAVQDIRELIYDLRPPALDDLGLIEALRKIGDRMATPDFAIRIEPDFMQPELSAAVEVAAFRITQESIHNALRHSRGSEVSIRLHTAENILFIEICDNGTGLPAQHRRGLGLLTIQERVDELQGFFEIDSHQPHGTRLVVGLPLT